MTEENGVLGENRVPVSSLSNDVIHVSFEIFSVHGMKVYEGRAFNLSSRFRWVGQLLFPTVLPTRKASSASIGGWVGTRAGVDAWRRQEFVSPTENRPTVP